MTGEHPSPYSATMVGSINGEPHTIIFDTKEVLARRYELSGETIAAEQLDTEALQLATDIHRVRETLAAPKPEPSRLERIAAKVGSFIRG